MKYLNNTPYLQESACSCYQHGDQTRSFFLWSGQSVLCLHNTKQKTQNTRYQVSSKAQGPRPKANYKGQASLELLITLGVVLAFSLPVVFLLLTVSQFGFEDTSKFQADATVIKIADNINEIYAKRAFSKTTLLVNLPANTKEIKINNKEVIVEIDSASGKYEAAAPIFAEARDVTIPGKRGPVVILLNVDSSGKVLVNG